MSIPKNGRAIGNAGPVLSWFSLLSLWSLNDACRSGLSPMAKSQAAALHSIGLIGVKEKSLPPLTQLILIVVFFAVVGGSPMAWAQDPGKISKDEEGLPLRFWDEWNQREAIVPVDYRVPNI